MGFSHNERHGASAHRKGGGRATSSWGKRSEEPGRPWPSLSESRLWARENLQDRVREEHIYHLLFCRPLLRLAWRRVRQSPELAGIDHQTVVWIEAKIGEEVFLERLRAELKAGYRPSPVRVINRRGRHLSIRVVKDRVVETALDIILRAIWEPTFHPGAFAYRPGRGAPDALVSLRRTRGAYDTAVVADIEAAFDSLRHDAVLAQIQRRIKDKEVLSLLRRFLRAARTPSPTRALGETRAVGIGAGAILGNVLINIALTDTVDVLFVDADTPIPMIHTPDPFPLPIHSHPSTPPVGTVAQSHLPTDGLKGLAPLYLRYSDDIVVLCAGGQAQGEKIRARIEEALQPLGLRLNPRKTQVVPLTRGFDFLGVHLTWPGPTVTVAEKKMTEWVAELYGALDNPELVSRFLQSRTDWLISIGGDLDDANLRLKAGLLGYRKDQYP